MKDIQLNELKDYIKKQPEDFFVTADLTALTDEPDIEQAAGLRM